jgi:hypothetical protein
MLEGERTSLVGMASEAAWLVSRERLQLLPVNGAVRVVAIDARHCALRHTMGVWLSELRPGSGVACAALLIHLAWFSHDHAVRTVAMYTMTGGAVYLASRVTSLNTACSRRFVEVATHARFVRVDAGESTWIVDVFSRGGLPVLASGPVTRLTSLTFPAPAGTELYGVVRILLKSVKNVLVTGLAYLRPDIGSLLVCYWRSGRLFLWLDLLGLRSNGEAKKESPCEQHDNSGPIAISLTGHSEHVDGRS